MNVIYCDICEKKTGYNQVRLKMNKPRTGHGVNINWDLCSECGRTIEDAVRSIRNATPMVRELEA